MPAPQATLNPQSPVTSNRRNQLNPANESPIRTSCVFISGVVPVNVGHLDDNSRDATHDRSTDDPAPSRNRWHAFNVR